MNVLVTGARGFLGGFLVKDLEKRGHRVTAFSSSDVDLREAASLDSFVGPFDLIFHLAAWTQAGDFCLHHAGEQWLNNQLINATVVNWWHTRQPDAFLVTMGTSCAYDTSLPLVEDNYLTGKPIDSLFTYAMTKRMLYAGQLALAKQFGQRSLCVVPSTLYGPGYHLDGRQMHFIFDLIRKILRAVSRGEVVELWGDGHQRRELIHVADFVRLVLELADMQVEGLVNVGTGVDHSIREFADLISTLCGYDPTKIRYDTTRYVGARAKTLSNTRLKQLLPSTSFVPLDAGLSQTITWFQRDGVSLL